jgi:hypothetical protein
MNPTDLEQVKNYELTVDPEQAGERIDKYIADSLEEG